MAQCPGQSDTPGKLQKFGSSLTVGEDGLIKQSRFFLKASRTDYRLQGRGNYDS